MAVRRKRSTAASSKGSGRFSLRLTKWLEADHPRGVGGKFRTKDQKKQRQKTTGTRQRAVTEIRASEGAKGRKVRGTFVLGDDDVWRRVDSGSSRKAKSAPKEAKASPKAAPAKKPEKPPKSAPARAPEKPAKPKAAPKPAPEKPKGNPSPKPSGSGGLPEHGPSRATVAHFGVKRESVEAATKNLLGKDATLQHVASAVGAPDDSRVSVTSLGTEEVYVTIKGTGYNASRRIYKGGDDRIVIHNESFFVDKEHQGKGLGASVFGRQVEQASKLGVARITTHAAGDVDTPSFNGYTTWPKFGYDGNIPREVALDIHDGNIPEPPVRGATRVSHLMGSKAGREWWTENGKAVDLTFDLTPGSYSRRTWDAYRAEKAKKGK
jgi:GNAT superfamily N-acetyltransferase